MKFPLDMAEFHGIMIVMMIARPTLHATLEKALARSRVVALIGPRQCGKTTLDREFVRRMA